MKHDSTKTYCVLMTVLVWLLALCALVFDVAAQAAGVDIAAAQRLDPHTEYNYCGPPKRDAHGQIVRSQAVLRAYQQIHPCPSTGLRIGACPDWSLNHNKSLACGGCDSVSNLSWVHNSIKTCAGSHCIDRYERKINALSPPLADTAACTAAVVP